MNLRTGDYAYVPGWGGGTVKVQRERDLTSGQVFLAYKIERRGAGDVIVEADVAEQKGVRGAHPPAIVDLMLRIVSNRSAAVLPGTFERRNYHHYNKWRSDDPIFANARIMRDIVERRRRSKRLRKRRLTRGLTDEEALLVALRTELEYEVAGSMMRDNPGATLEALRAAAVPRVEEALTKGSPYSMLIY